MAWRFPGSDSAYVRRTSSLPSHNNMTACGWAMLPADTNKVNVLCIIDNLVDSYWICETASDGTTLQIASDNVLENDIGTITPGVPFFWAVTASGTDSGETIGYMRSLGSNTLLSQPLVGNRNFGWSAGEFRIGSTPVGNSEYWTGEIGPVMVFDRVLTAHELEVQSYYARPMFATSLHLWWPATDPSSAQDLSGNGRNGTIAGALTAGDLGNQLWSPRKRIFLPAKAAGGGAVELVIAGASHGHAADSISLTQAHTLSIDDVIHAQASGSVSLTQASSLSIAGTAHAHVAGSAGLTQANVIAIASAVHAHLASSIDLVQAGTLSVGDAQHGQAATGVALAQASSLDVSGIVHALASSSPTLSQHGALAIDDAAHEQAASELSLTQASVLEVDGAAHELVSDEPVIPAHNALSIPKSTHGQTSADVTLVQAHVLDLSDSAHSLVSTQVAVSQGLVLSVADAMHGTFGDSIELSVSQMLAVSAAAHLHASDPIALTQAHVLIMSDALHAQIAQQLNLRKPEDLAGAELFIVKAEDRFYIVAPTERYMVH